MRVPAPRPGAPARPAPRRGYVLFAVLLVTVVLALTAYRFTDSMVTENAVALRSTEQAQARLCAVSGVYYAAGLLADPDAMASVANDVSDNADLFSAQPVGARGRFSLVNVSEALDGTGTGEARYPLRYGVVDEGGRINVNALIAADGTGTLLTSALIALPNMTAEIADAIANWVIGNGSLRPLSGDDAYYASMATPYQRKKGPLNSIDELLMVQGVTPQLLFGNDRNRNGKLDAVEDDGTEFNRGWSEYLTCHGREVNVDSTGQPRLNLNGPDIKTLSDRLTALVGQDLSDYIVYYRISNSSTAAAPLTANQVVAPAGQLRDLVQKAVDDNRSLASARKLANVLSVFKTQIALPAPPPKTSTITLGNLQLQTQVAQPTPVAACPINDPAALKNAIVTLVDKCTTEDGYEIAPRINVNTAPQAVLAALKAPAQLAGLTLTDDDIANFVTSRSGLNLADPEVSTGAWLVTQGQMKPEIFRELLPYISGRSWTYRVHAVGYAGPPAGQGPSAIPRRGPVARVEAVIDVGTRTTDGTNQGLPRILYFRDLTDLGRGFADLPGSQ